VTADAATPGDSPDAELIALCARFDALEREKLAWHAAHDDPSDDEMDAAIDPLNEQQKELIDPILDARAVTPAGFIARAKSILLWAPDFTPEDAHEGWHTQMAGALIRDLIATEGRTPA
jgi:hypothetical protein